MIDLINDTVTAFEVAALDAVVLYLIVRYFMGSLKKLWAPKPKKRWPWQTT